MKRTAHDPILIMLALETVSWRTGWLNFSLRDKWNCILKRNQGSDAQDGDNLRESSGNRQESKSARSDHADMGRHCELFARNLVELEGTLNALGPKIGRSVRVKDLAEEIEVFFCNFPDFLQTCFQNAISKQNPRFGNIRILPTVLKTMVLSHPRK